MLGATQVRRAVGVVLIAVVLATVGACSGADDGTGADGSSGATGTAPPGSEAVGTTEAPCVLPAAGTHTIEAGGTSRSYDVYPPATAAASTPVLVLFHGFNSTKEEMANLTGLADQAPAAGVVLVVPQGAGAPAGWNVLSDFESDAAFTGALLAEIGASSCVDPDAVWLAGFSAGSAFAAVYGCTHPDQVAGLGLVSALAPAICPPDQTPNVVIAHGTADPVVPFAGGDQAVGDTKVPLGSVTDSATTWATRAGCGPQPTVAPVGDDITVTQWSGCTGGSTVTFQVVAGGGHAWPGAVHPVALGRTTQTISESCVLLAAIADPALTPFPACPGDGPASP